VLYKCINLLTYLLTDFIWLTKHNDHNLTFSAFHTAYKILSSLYKSQNVPFYPLCMASWCNG